MYKLQRRGPFVKGFGLAFPDNCELVDLMTCKYCIKAELGYCSKRGGTHKYEEPFYLCDNIGRYLLVFDCRTCRMLVRRAL